MYLLSMLLGLEPFANCGNTIKGVTIADMVKVIILWLYVTFDKLYYVKFLLIHLLI